MKFKFTLVIALVTCFVTGTYELFAQAPSDIIISEYVEGSSNNKAIELYNGTGSPVNLTAGNYVIQMYFNGSTTAGLTIPLTGTIAGNNVFVITTSQAAFITANGGTFNPDQTSSASWFNGDDAIVLKKGGASGIVLDAIGQIGFDPGTEYGTGLISTADNTLRRITSDCTGDTNTSDAFVPSAKWVGFAQDDFTGLGSHVSSCATAGSPITVTPSALTFTTSPAVPSAEQAYTVQGNALTVDISVTAPANFGISTVAGGPYTANLTIPFAAANAGPVTIYVVYTNPVAGANSGNITNVSGSSASSVAVQGTSSAAGITPIYQIQGSGQASTMIGNIITTEGIVTGDFQATGQLSGFYIQDITGDGDSATSDGIFVYNTTYNVSVGDKVRLTAAVDEFNNLTELKNLTSLTVLSSGNALMPPAVITLPLSTLTEMERFEGMYVTFPQTLTVTETFTLARFGEVPLSVDGRLFNPTHFVDPNDNPASGTNSSGTSNVAAVTAQQNLNDRRRIVLDDGSSVQNPAIVPYLNPADTTLRSGSTLAGLTGVIDYAFDLYRLQPTQAPAFNYAPRPAVPSVGAANVKVASFNVLNYFNGNGSGGGFPTERGANTLVEFNRQRVKIINAIKQLNADVVGLIEIENDGDGPASALADLVNGLNAATTAGTYQLILDPTGANGNSGTDAIRQAIIYKPAVVTPVGLAKADMNAAHNRPPIAQTFTVNTNGEKFTFIVTHFKSKSCTSASGANVDQGDGQGCYNQSRKQQAAAFLSFITGIQASTGDSDVISMGDYNAYEQEDPLDILAAGGLKNILPGAYSYVFDGQTGSLDHVFVTSSVVAQVAGADKWHINADEPIALDYNQEFNPSYVYTPGPFRSSDHDPVLVGLLLKPAGNTAPTVQITSPATGTVFSSGSNITVHVNAADADGTITRVEFYNGSDKIGEDTTAPYELTGTEVEPGTYVITVRATDNDSAVTVSDTVRLTVTACSGSGSITAEGYVNIPGNTVASLTSDPSYPDNPAVTISLPLFEYGTNLAENYGARVRGYICAPLTGNYTFYIAGDDQAGLWLSTDENPANKALIAYTELPVPFRSWYVRSTQKSAPKHLVKGARYYIETLHKESTGTDHVSVAWTLPNNSFEAPVPGSRLSPWTASGARVMSSDFNAKMKLASGVQAEQTELIATVTPNPSGTYFRLNTISAGAQLLSGTVTDATGRIVEKLTNVPSNGKTQFGANYHPGIYFVEIRQGNQSVRVKLIKQ